MRKKYNLQFILLFILIIILASIPLFHNQIVLGDDLSFHILRIRNLSESLKHFDLFPKIDVLTLNGYGYGSNLMYPNIFLYLPAILHVLGLDIVLSYKIFVIFIHVITCLICYYTCYKISNGKYASLVASAIYTLCQYRMLDVYSRGSVGEYLAITFVPLIVLGVYDYLFDDFNNPHYLGVGFWGLMMSHTISLEIMMAVTIVIFLINYKKVFIKEKIVKLCITAIIVLLASAIYLFPMIEQFLFYKFNVSHTAGLWEYGMSLKDLFNMNKYGIGIIVPLLLIIRFFIRDRRKVVLGDQCLVAGLFALYMTTKYFPWKLISKIFVIQFPWRMNAVAMVFFAIAIAIYLKNINNKYFYYLEMSLIIISVVLFNQSLQQRFYSTQSSFDDTCVLGAGEWLPEGTNTSLLTDSSHVIYDKNIINMEKNYNSIKFVAKSTGKYDIPLLYYKGYVAYIDNGEKKEYQEVCKKENNLVCVNVSKENSRVVVKYEGTLIQKVSVWVTFVTFIYIIMYFVKKSRYNV